MAEKLHEYQGFVGRLHTFRETVSTRWQEWKEKRKQQRNLPLGLLGRSHGVPPPAQNGEPQYDYSHIYRKKKFMELVRVSTAVMGIEFSYAAETAFVSPTLLQIGVEHRLMTLVWALSPLVGFFVTPLLGSLSDRCRLAWGRRRPFIVLLAAGVLVGLILVPNGADLGYAMGDPLPQPLPTPPPPLNFSDSIVSVSNNETTEAPPPTQSRNHAWGVFFTILGTVLLDFDADACQSPARAYLLDVTVPEDHAKGLSTFTIMAGLGGFLGYALGGINWDATALGKLLGGHVKAVFTLITFIFIICVTTTVTSFKEIPLDILEKEEDPEQQAKKEPMVDEKMKISKEADARYGAVATDNSGQEGNSGKEEYKPIEGQNVVNGYVNYGYDETYQRDANAETSFNSPEPKEVQGVSAIPVHPTATLAQYLLSIVYMPNSMRILCLTNLFCWMAHVCYSLYFTDFVGEAVFNGDPKAAENSLLRILYDEGVRFGCWGMSMYSLSCACYSFIIERLIKRFRARRVYVGGLLVYSTGMLLMALTKHRVGVILFSWTAGVMYSTLFTMPYLLIAHYHASGTFEVTETGEAKLATQLRGLGTDVAIVSSMVFLAQFILSMCMGSIVSLAGTTTAVVGVASFLSFCGAIVATQVMYLDL